MACLPQCESKSHGGATLPGKYPEIVEEIVGFNNDLPLSSDTIWMKCNKASPFDFRGGQ